MKIVVQTQELFSKQINLKSSQSFWELYHVYLCVGES